MTRVTQCRAMRQRLGPDGAREGGECRPALEMGREAGWQNQGRLQEEVVAI